LAKLREGNALEARDLLIEAIGIDGEHAFSHLALAQTWTDLGYDSRAQEEAKRAVALAGPLGREEHLVIEAYQHKVNFDWPNAIKTYQLLFDFYPDNIEYGLALADAQIRAARAEAALATLERLPSSLAGAREDPRVELGRAQAYVSMGNHQKAIEAATAARQKAQARGAELLMARADAQAADGYWRLDRCDKVVEIANQARPVLSRVIANQALTSLDNALGACLFGRGDYAGALRTSDEVIRICEATGNHKPLAAALNNSAGILRKQGHYEEAHQRYERAAAVFKEINDEARRGAVLANLGLNLDDQGQPAEALRLVEEAVAIHRRIDSKTYLVGSLIALAGRLEAMGELERARRAVEESRALTVAQGVTRRQADTFLIGARVMIHAGELELARQSLVEAQRLFRQIGDPLEPILVEVRSAAIDREEGKLASGEARVRSAIAELEKLPRNEVNSEGLSVAQQELADVLTAHEQVREARQALDRALALAPKQRPFFFREELLFTQARVEAAEGHIDRAQSLLARAYAEVHAAKHPTLELEARLAQVELLASLPESQAKASYRQLARGLHDDAAKLGFSLIAKKASAALKN
jgi:tetratricopeptide (TPR) repeat protein